MMKRKTAFLLYGNGVLCVNLALFGLGVSSSLSLVFDTSNRPLITGNSSSELDLYCVCPTAGSALMEMLLCAGLTLNHVHMYLYWLFSSFCPSGHFSVAVIPESFYSVACFSSSACRLSLNRSCGSLLSFRFCWRWNGPSRHRAS